MKWAVKTGDLAHIAAALADIRAKRVDKPLPQISGAVRLAIETGNIDIMHYLIRGGCEVDGTVVETALGARSQGALRTFFEQSWIISEPIRRLTCARLANYFCVQVLRWTRMSTKTRTPPSRSVSAGHLG